MSDPDARMMDGASAEAAEAMEAVKPAENGEMEAAYQGSEVANGDVGQPASVSGATSSTLKSLTPRAHFERYKALYDAGLDCDLTLTCADSQGLRCHAAVLAAAFPVLGNILLGDEDGPYLDEYAVFLADFDADEVRRVIDWVYSVLVSTEDQSEDGKRDLYISEELAAAICAGHGVNSAALLNVQFTIQA